MVYGLQRLANQPESRVLDVEHRCEKFQLKVGLLQQQYLPTGEP